MYICINMYHIYDVFCSEPSRCQLDQVLKCDVQIFYILSVFMSAQSIDNQKKYVSITMIVFISTLCKLIHF